MPHSIPLSPYVQYSPPIYILVTGTRHGQYEPWADIIASAIQEHTQGEPYVLVHGQGRGIDKIAHTVAFRTNPVCTKAQDIHTFPADWHGEGLAAGPIRNSAMRDFLVERMGEGHRAVCLAFHDDLNSSKGTKDMCRKAKAAGIAVYVYDGKAVR